MAYIGNTPASQVLGASDISDDIITTAKLAFAESTLTDGSTIDWNAATQDVCKVTLAGNIIQDGSGSRTVSFNAIYEFKDDTAPTLTTTASKGDVFVFRYNGSKWLEMGRNTNLTLS